jgi:uncharacterized membrane protein YgcG
MKTFVSHFNASVAGLALLTLSAGGVMAQDAVAQPVGQPAAQTAQPSSPPPTAAPPLTLSYGVSQVIQLSKANIGEPTILAYIQSSGNAFNLDASQIVYLKQEGVSDGVVKAMLDQKNRPGAVPAQPQYASAPAPQAQVAAPSTPAPIIVQQQPSSSVYVIPDAQTYYYNSYDPYYYGYYGWGAPVVGIGWGWGWYGGHWGYGYHGGGWHGGGWHGGGGGWHGGGGGGHGGGGHH